MRSQSPVTEGHHAASARVWRARPLLGTFVEIRASAEPSIELQSVVDKAFAAIERVHRLMSYHEPDSDLSRLNRTAPGRFRRVDPHVHAVLSAALRFAELSDGAFDPCVADTLEDWGYLPGHAWPARARPARAGPRGRASWRDIELADGERVRLKRALRIDLGGIAKGYAVDVAAGILRRAGARSFVVNAGGDLKVGGAESQAVSLRDPREPARVSHRFTLCEQALATSAVYDSRRRRGSLETSALLDPRRRSAYVGAASVSVCASDCVTADALTKVVLFAPARVAEAVLARCEARALVQQPF